MREIVLRRRDQAAEVASNHGVRIQRGLTAAMRKEAIANDNLHSKTIGLGDAGWASSIEPELLSK
jgi:hypothetical protein